MEINVPSFIKYHKLMLDSLVLVIQRLDRMILKDDVAEIHIELLIANQALRALLDSHGDLMLHINGRNELELEMGRVIYRPESSSPL